MKKRQEMEMMVANQPAKRKKKFLLPFSISAFTFSFKLISTMDSITPSAVASTSGLTANSIGTMPRKRFYRQRAHANPLSIHNLS